VNLSGTSQPGPHNQLKEKPNEILEQLKAQKEALSVMPKESRIRWPFVLLEKTLEALELSARAN
jgi:hypothetical protein